MAVSMRSEFILYFPLIAGKGNVSTIIYKPNNEVNERELSHGSISSGLPKPLAMRQGTRGEVGIKPKDGIDALYEFIQTPRHHAHFLLLFSTGPPNASRTCPLHDTVHGKEHREQTETDRLEGRAREAECDGMSGRQSRFE